MQKMYWNMTPGVFVNKMTGKTADGNALSKGPKFTGTVDEWYETFIETLIDASRYTYKVPGAKIFVNKDIAGILECSVLFRPILDENHELPKEGPVGRVSDMPVHIDNSLGFEARVTNGENHVQVVIMRGK